MGAVGAGSTIEQTWNTVGLPESDQFAFWQQAASEAFCPVVVRRRDEGSFVSRVAARRVGAINVSRITSAGQVVTRTPGRGDIRSGDLFFLNLPLSRGTSARQDGRAARLVAGDFAIVDSTRSFELEFDGSFDQISLAVPHDLIARRLTDPTAATAVRVSGARGVGAFASTMLQRLANDPSPLDRAAARGANERLADLVALALGGARVPPRSATRGMIMQAALDEIDRSLADPGLTPADVAGRVHISTRYLHQLFSEHGLSFGRWVAHRRLHHCHEALRDPRHAHRTISEIAFDHGIHDASYFARVYRARYGLTPGQRRRMTRAPQAERSRTGTLCDPQR